MATPPPNDRAAKELKTADDLRADPKNANRGTPRGRQLLGNSLRDYGAARSIVTDREGTIIAGNKTFEKRGL